MSAPQISELYFAAGGKFIRHNEPWADRGNPVLYDRRRDAWNETEMHGSRGGIHGNSLADFYFDPKGELAFHDDEVRAMIGRIETELGDDRLEEVLNMQDPDFMTAVCVANIAHLGAATSTPPPTGGDAAEESAGEEESNEEDTGQREEREEREAERRNVNRLFLVLRLRGGAGTTCAHNRAAIDRVVRERNITRAEARELLRARRAQAEARHARQQNARRA